VTSRAPATAGVRRVEGGGSPAKTDPRQALIDGLNLDLVGEY
jgi:hypothetical protein